MPLAAGQSLAHYRLIEPLGEGGMGVVWRAHDDTLGRDAALKVLPDLFAGDPERMARFEREARMLAALNHPHIASIHGFHSADGVRFLAMELVEGEDLAKRLSRGPIPIGEALPLALQVAQALEHAHERGVIHRDLKPANVKLTSAGQAKVLDFGLAKALEGDVGRPVSSPSLSQSPTITNAMTGAHVLLGTAAYMAPEQARGHAADRRADIWAFGVLLMEMLTGRRLFEGETVSDTLASVLKSDPDWTALPADTPPRIRRLLRRCLERDPKRRLRDIGEARIMLEETVAGVPDEAAPVPAAVAPTSARSRRALALGAAGLVLGAGITWGTLQVLSRPAAPAPLLKYRLSNPGEAGASLTSPAISPDGRAVAFLTQGKLWVQSLGELDPRSLAVENGAASLFWSPDAKWVGYLAGTRIMKVAVQSGENALVCDTRAAFTGGQGAAWGADGRIVFSRGDSAGVMQVSALGGDAHTLVRPDTSESDLHEPSLLPGGRGVLFCGHRHRGGIDNIGLWADGKRRTLVEMPGQTLYNPVYSATGHLLFRRTPTTPGVWAVPFSLSRLQVTGEPFLVAPAGTRPTVGGAAMLAYVQGSAGGATQFGWSDRSGRELGTLGRVEPQMSRVFSLSPDGTRVVCPINENDNEDLWILDAVRGTRTRLTFEPGNEQMPAWSPDGRRVAYHAVAPGCSAPSCLSVLVRSADGGGRVDTVAAGAMPRFTPDGGELVFLTFGANNWNIERVPVTGGPSVRIVTGNPRVADPHVRPGGGLMAYESNESGHWEVYLTRYPDGEGRWQVSVAGGQWPRWSPRGDRLWFSQDEDIMEVDVTGGDTPVLGQPRKLFSRPALGIGNWDWYAAFDVTPDGNRFVFPRAAGVRGAAQGVTVVQNWPSEFADRK